MSGSSKFLSSESENNCANDVDCINLWRLSTETVWTERADIYVNSKLVDSYKFFWFYVYPIQFSFERQRTLVEFPRA